MRLILVDTAGDRRMAFDPLALSRPIWDLRCGMTSLGEKLVAATGMKDLACFVPDYMAGAYRESTQAPVNDASTLKGDILLVDARVKAASLNVKSLAPNTVVPDDEGNVLLARLSGDGPDADRSSIEAVLGVAADLPRSEVSVQTWNYTWELILENPAQLARDFEAAGLSGIEGTVEQPNAIRGSAKDIFIAPGALVHPMVVLDAEHGPIFIDEGAEIHPFTRIEGPCYIGKKSILLGAKCREGNSIGPVCRIGGEVEESIVQGYSNKYHDGFLGHAYVGEWVNLGALTTNSDLKNDYSDVSVVLDGRRAIPTGSRKVGSLIGDHTKTSIGTLFNTGAYVGSMALIAGTGKPLPKFIPSFAWFLEGVVTKGFGKRKLYQTAQTAVGRRGREWTEAQESMWDFIYELTAAPRNEAIKKGRRVLTARSN